MTRKEEIATEIIELTEELEQIEGKKIIDMGLPVRPIESRYLFDLMTIFCWLDIEHQDRAVSALNSVLQDQIAETKGITKAI